MKKAWITTVVILLLLSGCENEKVVQEKVIKPVKILHVESTKSLLNFKIPGTIRAAKRAELSFDIPGRIVELNAIEGAKVSKGDVIARLNKSDYENNYLSAQANFKEAELALGRSLKLYDKKVITRAELERAQKGFDVEKADMKIAQKALDNTELRAYFSGTISVRYVENFKNIQAKEPIVSMEDRSILEIVVNVPEKIIATFHEEDIVSLKASFETILNEKFPLVVKEISTKADNATRTYAVVLVMQPPSKYNILSGMTADVEVILAKNTQIDKILIPSTAVLGDKENKSFVWIYAKNSSSVLKREVSIGEMSGVAIEIQSGLQAGEIIVSAGVNYLFDGMVVRPLAGKLGE